MTNTNIDKQTKVKSDKLKNILAIIHIKMETQGQMEKKSSINKDDKEVLTHFLAKAISLSYKPDCNTNN